MSIKVSVNSIPKYRVSIENQNDHIVRTVGVGGNIYVTGTENLTELNDVNASDANDGETIVYDANTNTYIVKELPVLRGGTF
jgi:hypothetical protein